MTQLTLEDALRYISINHLDKPVKDDECHFCQEHLKMDYSGMSYTTEVGEFWSLSMQQSVLAHPDCLPRGIDAVFEQTDPEWRTA